MPARKRPTPWDTVTARRVLLDGLARDADIFELVSELAPLHPRDNTFPGEVFIRVAADALDWCGASRADPRPLEGLRERFLPETSFRGRETRSSSTRCWPQQPFMAGPNRTCLMRWAGGRLTISGGTRCSRWSPASGPPPAGRASRCARHAGSWASALAIRRHNDQFGTQRKRSPDGGAAGHIGCSRSRWDRGASPTGDRIVGNGALSGGQRPVAARQSLFQLMPVTGRRPRRTRRRCR
jgi:hypothetical protein